MKTTERRFARIGLVLLSGAILFGLLQYFLAYHFFYLEQQQIFQTSSAYLIEHLCKIGGGVSYLSEALTQFYILPYGGAFINTGLILLMGIFSIQFFQSIRSTLPLTVLALLPVALLGLYQLHHLYTIKGSISFILVLSAVWGYISLTHYRTRLLAALFLTAILFWITGSAAILLGICISIWELSNHKKRWSVCIVPAFALLLATAALFRGYLPSASAAYTPDFYCHLKAEPSFAYYLAWLTIPLLIGVARYRKPVKLLWKTVFVIAQCLLVVVLSIKEGPEVLDLQSLTAKEMLYHLRRGEWDDVIKKGSSVNDFLSQNMLNLALAQKGVLIEKLFEIKQHGARGLIVESAHLEFPAIIYHEICYYIGHIGLAQRYAFEGNMHTVSGQQPELIKRLVKTNLITGSYRVAEKYIKLLENTLFYRDWATDQRRFLDQPETIAADPELGMKQRQIPVESYLVSDEITSEDFHRLLSHNPENKAAFQYSIAWHLLAKKPDPIRAWIDQFRGTPLLPQLPITLQEAIIIIDESDVDYWKQVGVTEETVKRFIEFKKNVVQGKNKQQLATVLAQRFKQSYWFYYMFN